MDLDNNSSSSQNIYTPNIGQSVNTIDWAVPGSDIPQKNNKKRWSLIIIAVLALLVIVFISTMLIGGKSHKTISIGSASIDIPKHWLKIGNTINGFDIGFIDSGNNSVGAPTFYAKEIKHTAQATAIDENTKNEFQKNIINYLNSKPDDICSGDLKINKQSSIGNDKYVGLDVAYSCSKNTTGMPFDEYDRYILMSDGDYYQFSVVSSSAIWQNESQNLTDIIKGIRIEG